MGKLNLDILNDPKLGWTERVLGAKFGPLKKFIVDGKTYYTSFSPDNRLSVLADGKGQIIKATSTLNNELLVLKKESSSDPEFKKTTEILPEEEIDDQPPPQELESEVKDTKESEGMSIPRESLKHIEETASEVEVGGAKRVLFMKHYYTALALADRGNLHELKVRIEENMQQANTAYDMSNIPLVLKMAPGEPTQLTPVTISCVAEMATHVRFLVLRLSIRRIQQLIMRQIDYLSSMLLKEALLDLPFLTNSVT